jgi:DNA-binding transcriptional regulator YdaS (Cro superfamily)
MNPTTANLWHGYTMDDLYRIAREALTADRWRTSRDLDERYAAAWHAIAETIALTAGAATHDELLDAGVRASHAVVRQADQSHGYTREGGIGRNFTRHWDTVARHSPSPENAVVERLALTQVWQALPEHHREVLHAYSTAGDQQAAAELLGLSRTGLGKRLRAARQDAAALWHDHEAAPALGRNRRPGARNRAWKGRPRLTESEVDALRARYHAGGITYAGLASEIGAHPDRLSELIRGVRSPAPDQAAA